MKDKWKIKGREWCITFCGDWNDEPEQQWELVAKWDWDTKEYFPTREAALERLVEIAISNVPYVARVAI